MPRMRADELIDASFAAKWLVRGELDRPTRAVTFEDGRVCHACCAIDALGVPARGPDPAGRALNFFRSEEHVGAWWATRPDVSGAAATMVEGFRLAARIFGDLLGAR